MVGQPCNLNKGWAPLVPSVRYPWQDISLEETAGGKAQKAKKFWIHKMFFRGRCALGGFQPQYFDWGLPFTNSCLSS
jgi:hypothetical protein